MVDLQTVAGLSKRIPVSNCLVTMVIRRDAQQQEIFESELITQQQTSKLTWNDTYIYIYISYIESSDQFCACHYQPALVMLSSVTDVGH